MFARPRKPAPGFATIQPEEIDPPKYPKPRILLVDLKDDSDAVLRKAGFNVSSGTFGTPYRVPKSDQYFPVIPNAKLMDVEEQEVVIIDLVPEDPLDQPEGEKLTSDGENDWWAKCSVGVIDPRPRIMALYQGAFDRILNHGGVFVLFGDSRDVQKIVFGHVRRHYGFTKESDIEFDNWSFLSIFNLNNVDISHDRGTEMVVDKSAGELGSLIASYIGDARFLSTLRWGYQHRSSWASLVSNKYGASVGGLLLPDSYRKGLIFIFPQFRKKSAFISDLLISVLPNLVPHLFPHIEGARWVERPAYEIAGISELKSEIDRVRTEAESKIQELEKQIEAERKESAYLHDLIRETDQKLVSAVKGVLTLFGFKKIVDVDDEMVKKGQTERDEDLQIQDYSPLLLVEIKGVSGLPSDDDALQVAKHIAPRIKQLKRHDVRGLSIINHQRHIPALDRENVKPFREVVVTAATKQDVGLMTAWDLFRLARSFPANKWTHKQVKDIFYQSGRISPLPNHYRFLGTIDHFWEEAGALSVKIENGVLKKGDMIAFELPVEFVEQSAESLQLNGLPVEEVSHGSIVGIETTLRKDQARKGARVYRIFESGDTSTAVNDR